MPGCRTLAGGRAGFFRHRNPVLPALERALLTATVSEKADLLAHLGWADFLTIPERRVEPESGDAIPRSAATGPGESIRSCPPRALDSLEKTVRSMPRNRSFSAALGVGRARGIRAGGFSSPPLQNRRSDEAEAEILRVVMTCGSTRSPWTRTRAPGCSRSIPCSSPRRGPRRQSFWPRRADDQFWRPFNRYFSSRISDQSKRPIREVVLAALQEAAGYRRTHSGRCNPCGRS